jgi:hypothetical protein
MKRNVKKKKWFFYTKLENDKNLKVTHTPIKNITKSWPKKKLSQNQLNNNKMKERIPLTNKFLIPNESTYT